MISNHKSLLANFLLVSAVLLLAAACGGGEKPAPTPGPTSTPHPIPSPVTVDQVPAPGFTLADPKLDALPNAKTEYGTLGGTVFQIEVPDAWNGRLMLYMHGNEIDTTLRVYPPTNRGDLVRNGFAWASSSYSVNVAVVSGVAADETAALWDYFVTKHGRPAHTYVEGDSMGGTAVINAAERYGDRYDAGLALCAGAPPADEGAEFFFAGAYIAGLRQSDYDATDIGTLVDTRIKPALRDPATRARFEKLWFAITGGPRPLTSEGLRIYESKLWVYAINNIVGKTQGNDGRQYQFGTSAGVSVADYNRDVIRVKADPAADKYRERNRVTGKLQIPVLAMQPTGDELTQFSEERELRRRIDAAGKGDLFVQRAIQSPLHCLDGGLTQQELHEAVAAIVAWAEDGTKPGGEDLSGDVSNAGAKFTRTPRLGSTDAAAVSGAKDRVTLHGSITLDGQPVEDGFLFAFIRRDGLLRPCSYLHEESFPGGQYQLALAPDSEDAGCGTPGAKAYVVLFKDGERRVAEHALDWPAPGGDVPFDASFTTARPQGDTAEASVDAWVGTNFYGAIVTKDEKPLAAGTPVEAYIGDTMCGRWTVPRTVMAFDEPSFYQLIVSPPSEKAGCSAGSTVTFKIGGQTIAQTGKHDLSPNGDYLDLVAP
jgi:pimeloyl-ACP methyl ester carboxylesterase